MITAISLAAAVLAASASGFPAATASVGVGIQGQPACVAADVMPGRSYPLTVSVTNTGSGQENISVGVVPETAGAAGRLRQVDPQWLSPAGVSLDGGKGAAVAVTLTVPPGTDPGPYWSQVEAGTSPVPGSGSGVSVTFGAAADAWLLFTVGPSATPPPPCDAFTLAEGSGKFPGWPTAAFATASWKQELGREDPPTLPTLAASPGPAVPVATFTPVAAAPVSLIGATVPKKLPADWPGWAIVIAFLLAGTWKALGWLGIRRG